MLEDVLRIMHVESAFQEQMLVVKSCLLHLKEVRLGLGVRELRQSVNIHALEHILLREAHCFGNVISTFKAKLLESILRLVVISLVT